MVQQAACHPPEASNYDVVIVGGAIFGSSVAWFLSNNPDFDGSVLVVERDPSYSACSTTHTNSCMRQSGYDVSVCPGCVVVSIQFHANV